MKPGCCQTRLAYALGPLLQSAGSLSASLTILSSHQDLEQNKPLFYIKSKAQMFRYSNPEQVHSGSSKYTTKSIANQSELWDCPPLWSASKWSIHCLPAAGLDTDWVGLPLHDLRPQGGHPRASLRACLPRKAGCMGGVSAALLSLCPLPSRSHDNSTRTHSRPATWTAHPSPRIWKPSLMGTPPRPPPPGAHPRLQRTTRSSPS
jgi:hypothetical protein